MTCCSFLNHREAQYLLLVKKCVKILLNSNVAVLQSCPGLHIIYYRLKKTSLFGTDACKNHIIIILIHLLVEKSGDLKVIILSSIANHITITISLQIIAIRHFLKMVQPLAQ